MFTTAAGRFFVTVGILFTLGNEVAWSASDAGKGMCDLTRQLEEDAELRADYMAYAAANNVRRIREDGDVGRMYGDIRPAGFDTPDGIVPGGGIDMLSLECLYCHDGGSAKSASVHIRGKRWQVGRAQSGHPIGTEYAEYISTRKSEEWRPLETLHPDMIFIKGKVGCLSCHNPLKKEKYHLVMSNEGSALCMTCHVH